MLSSNLEIIAMWLAEAKAPEEVFGKLANVDELHVVYRRLVKQTHPDVYPAATDDIKKIAAETFYRLNIWRDAAAVKLTDGTYGDGKAHAPVAPPAPTAAPVTVTVGKVTYTTGPILFDGDIATLYAVNAIGHASPFTETAIFKVARSAADNDLMEAESKALRLLVPKLGTCLAEDRLLPQLIDTFMLKGKGAARRVNVLTRHDDHYAMTEVKAAYPAGLDFRDWAWMFNRALQVLGFVHRKGLVHGAVLPPHILVHPVSHGIKLVDWSYSVMAPQHIKARVAAFRDYYPPEVAAKGKATPGLDIYMLAKCSVYLLGGDPALGVVPASVPSAIRSFLQGCMLVAPTRRPQDAWVLHTEFNELLERLVGPKKYRTFAMPERT
jgi:hypothetical protein